MNQNPRKNRKRRIPNDVIRYVDHSISIAKQIDVILKSIDKNQLYLANLLGKSESEISKWMTGTHNFTLKTISKIEAVLNSTLILCPIEANEREYQLLIFPGFQSFFVKEKANDIEEKLKQDSTYFLSTSAGKGVIPKECFVLNQ